MNLWKKFVEIENRFPNNIALQFGSDKLSFRELKFEVEKFSSFLTLKKERLVVLYYKKSIEYIIAFLACFRVGKIFIPIDDSIPENRLDEIINQLSNSIKLSNFFYREDFIFHSKSLFYSQKKIKEIQRQLAYIIFTSGSSGKPKGVLVSNKGILNFLESQIIFFEINKDSILLENLSIGFDASISEIGISLLSGAKLVIPTNNDYKKIILDEKISHICISPSILSTESISEFPNTLKKMILGGETCKIEVARKFSEKFDLINVYGPTEATVCTSFEKMHSYWEKNLIGKPIQNMNYKILDENGNEADSGELYISGIGLAVGYYKNPELNKIKFVKIKNQNFFKTGDKVSKVGENFEFIGRIDRQIKFNGKLIAPEEIEYFLLNKLNLEFVKLEKEFLNKREYLVLYYFSEINKFKIINELRENFPSWMIPNKFIKQKNLNWNQNQKLILKKEDNIEEFLKEILQIKKINFKKSFFENGGDSLKFLELISFLTNQKFNINLNEFGMDSTLNEIFKFQENKTYLVKDLEFKINFSELNFSFSKNFKLRKRIFITGSSGFLGSEIFNKLDYEKYKIYILKRELNQDNKYFHPNLSFIKGNLKEKNLGIPNTIWKSLKPDIILNIASNLNLSKNFYELEKENSNSIYEILELAKQNNSEIHHISTLSVLLSTNIKEKYLKEKSISEFQISEIYGGYASSKFLSEKILEKSNSNYFIYRLGLLTNSLNSKILQNSFFINFLKKIFITKKIPNLNPKLEINISPVNLIADEIIKKLFSPKKRIIHLANLPNLTFKNLADHLKEFDSSLKLVSEKEFNSTNLETYLLVEKSKLQHLNLFLATGFEFQVSNSNFINLKKTLFYYFNLLKSEIQ